MPATVPTAPAAALWSELTAKPNDLREPAVMGRLSDMDLARVVQYGGFEMPPLPGIQREELVALVAYVRSLSYPDLQEVELHPLTGRTVDGFVPVSAAKLGDPDPATADVPAHLERLGIQSLIQFSRKSVPSDPGWSRAMEPGEQETSPWSSDATMFLAPREWSSRRSMRAGTIIWEYRANPCRGKDA